MNLSNTVCRLFAAGFLLATSLGIQAAPAAKKPVPAAKKPVAKPAPKTPGPSIGNIALKPVASGPGVVIGDPTGANPAARAFGAGCTRWLFYTLGSRPELGKSPPWQRMVWVLRSGRVPNWQLEPGHIATVRQWLGVTHVVTTHIEGGTGTGPVPEGALTLTLQPREAVSGKPVTQEIRLTGSAEEIAWQLPQTVQALAVAAGIKNPARGSEEPITAEQLALAGQLPLDPYSAVDLNVVRRLRETAPQTPFVQMASWRAENYRTPLVKIDQTPETATLQALAFLDGYDRDQLYGYGAIVQSLTAKYPNNELANELRCTTALAKKEAGIARKAAEQAVRCAPQSAATWNMLSETYSDLASNIREGRVAMDVDEEEWQQLRPLYAGAWAAARRATELNPDSGELWLDLASSATFEGDMATANGAFWKAAKLDPKNQSVYNWGLEMFQPKWGGREADLAKVANLIAADDDLSLALFRKTLQALSQVNWRSGKAAEATKALYRRYLSGKNGYFQGEHEAQRVIVEKLWTAAWSQPDKAAAWKQLYEGLTQASADLEYGRTRYDFSLAELNLDAMLRGFTALAAQRVAELEPRSSQAWLNYAKAKAWAGGYREEIEQAMAMAAELDPKNPEVLSYQIERANRSGQPGHPGMLLILDSIAGDQKLVEALAPTIADILGTITPGYLTPGEQKWMDRAVAILTRMADIEDAAVQRRLTTLNWWQRDRARVRKTARNWVRLAPNDADAHYNLARFGGSQTEPVDIEAEYREALRLNPNHPGANFGLALFIDSRRKSEESDALYRRAMELKPYWRQPMVYYAFHLKTIGNLEEAQRLWQYVIDLGGVSNDVRMATDWLKASQAEAAKRAAQ